MVQRGFREAPKVVFPLNAKERGVHDLPGVKTASYRRTAFGPRGREAPRPVPLIKALKVPVSGPPAPIGLPEMSVNSAASISGAERPLPERSGRGFITKYCAPALSGLATVRVTDWVAES